MIDSFLVWRIWTFMESRKPPTITCNAISFHRIQFVPLKQNWNNDFYPSNSPLPFGIVGFLIYRGSFVEQQQRWSANCDSPGWCCSRCTRNNDSWRPDNPQCTGCNRDDQSHCNLIRRIEISLGVLWIAVSSLILVGRLSSLTSLTTMKLFWSRSLFYSFFPLMFHALIGISIQQSPRIYDDNTAYKLTLTALECGYRNFFASVLAGNQKGFAKAIRESNIPREDL